MEHVARGAKALEASDALTAVAEYTHALIQHPSSPDYFVRRSIAFSRLNPPRYDSSLGDAELAVLLGQKRAKRENIQAAQQRRVVALFGLGRYGDAAFLLETMLKWRKPDALKDKMEGQMWKAKIEQKMKALPTDSKERQIAVEEYPSYDLPSEKELLKMVESQLKKDGTFRFDGEEDTTEAETEDAPDRVHTRTDAIPIGQTNIDTRRTEATTTALAPISELPTATTNELPVGETNIDTKGTESTTTESASIPAPATVTKVRHEWYQNAQTVNVSVYVKGVAKWQSGIKIYEDSVDLFFPHPSGGGSPFRFTLNPLFAQIDPSASTSSVMATKIEVSLRKKVPGQKWPTLEGDARPKEVKLDSESATAKTADLSHLAQPPAGLKPESGPSYPTSSKSGPKDWDKLAETLTAKKKRTKKPTDKSRKGKNKEKENSGSSDDEDDGIDSDYDTGDAVDGFFKKLYAGADPDTKRAMMKSFQESNGTALSTDWSQVGKGKVGPVESNDDD